MPSRILLLALLAMFMVFAVGCLNVESKEYKFTVKPDGSGEGTMIFANFVSSDDDGRDVSFKDFGELVTDWMEGSKWDDENPGLKSTSKRLYEQDGKLYGEVKFTFTNVDSAGFLRFKGCDCAPVLYQLSKLSNETYKESNGSILGSEDSPAFVTWPSGTKEYTFRTTVLSDLEGTRSLLPHYKTWKETHK